MARTSSNLLAPVPNAKYILVRNNQMGPHPHEWCQKAIITNPLSKAINTQREEEEGVTHWRVRTRAANEHRHYDVRLEWSAIETGP